MYPDLRLCDNSLWSLTGVQEIVAELHEELVARLRATYDILGKDANV